MTNLEKAEYVIVQNKFNKYYITFIPVGLYEKQKEQWNVLDYGYYYTDACRKTDRWNEKITGVFVV